MQDAFGIPQRQWREPALVQQIAEIRGDAIVGTIGSCHGPIAEMLPESVAHGGQEVLRGERLIAIIQCQMEGPDVPHERRVLDVGIVDGPADQSFIQDVGIDVEHPLAEPVGPGRSTIVHDVRGEDRDPRAGRAAMRGLEVIPDGSLIDDEHRPGVVGMRRVRVIHEPGVEDLVDTGNRRPPRANPFAIGSQDGTIVQDPGRALRLGTSDGEPGWRRMVNALVAFVAFAFVGTVSPGPNNTLLWASGMRFGFRNTLPHVVGTAIGMGALVAGVATGIGAILDAVPSVETALKVVGSAYLLYLAYLILRSGRVGASDISHPLTLWQGFAFQWVNPKAWVFSVAAVGAFLPPTLPRSAGVAMLCAILMVIVIGSSSAWAAGGAGLGQIVRRERTRRAINVTLAALLVASVALIWM